MNRHHYGLILAGGRGTRFWPRSRRTRQAGPQRLRRAHADSAHGRPPAPVIPPERIWILTNDHLRDEIVQQLARDSQAPDSGRAGAAQHRSRHRPGGAHSAIDRSRRGDGRLPVRPRDRQDPRNTAPVVKAAFKAAAPGQHDGGRDPAALAGDRLRLHRISRSSAAGGDERRCRSARFREKPELAKAKRFVAAGNFYWNAGMFFWRTDVLAR